MEIKTVMIFLFLSPIVGFILFALIAAIISKRKGKIHFEVPRPYRYKPGEKVTGEIIITPGKTILADRVRVRVQCHSVYRNERKSGSSVHYQNESVVAERVSLHSKIPNRFRFELILPENVEMLPIELPGKVGHQLNQLIKTVGPRQDQLKWHLYGVVECEGIDLQSRTPLDVDIPIKS